MVIFTTISKYFIYREDIATYYGANAYNRRNKMMFANYKEINIEFVMQGIESAIRITYAQGYYECKI